MLCFVFLMAGCGKKSGKEKVGEKVEGVVETSSAEKGEEIDIRHKVHNFKLEGFTKTGEDQWYLEGELAKIFENDIILNKIKGESFNKEITVMLTADKGIYDRNSGSTELNGNVIVITSDGGRIITNHASWDKEKEEIKTDAYVKIEHRGIILEGRGATVLPKKKWAMLEKEIKMKDVSNKVISCDGPLEVDYEKREAVFNNNVEIIDQDGRIYANKVIAYFDPDKRKIEKIEWIGDVRAVY